MAILDVAKLGNPILRKHAKRVTLEESLSPAFQNFLDDMIHTMQELDGVGLAAPQVFASKQAIVISADANPRYPDAPNLSLLVILNPTITFYSEETQEGWEGCLSLDNLRGKVTRSTQIHVNGFTRFMEPISMDAEGFLSVVFQHEIDHLKGTLFVDRMKDFSTLCHLDEYDLYWSKREVGAQAE
ncbi:MAG: peptide deformylase [Nitrospirota bacterium]